MGKIIRFISAVSIFALVSALSAPVLASTGRQDLIYEFNAANYNPVNGEWSNTSGVNAPVVARSVATGSAMPAKGSSPDSVEFNGAVNGFQFITTEQYTNPQIFTLEVWFRTVASGKLVGFEGSTNPTLNLTYDRHLYVGADGLLYFGIFGAGAQLVNSTTRVNDGLWHHAVAIYSVDTSSLYLNGALVQSRKTGAAENLSGFWRLGGNRLGGWVSGSDGYFSGSLGEVRIYNRALTAVEVANSHSEKKSVYASSANPIPTPKPTVVNGVTYQPLGVSVKSSTGLVVTVSDLQLIEKVGSTQLIVTYSQTNSSTRKQVDEGSFKLFFTDGASMGQSGFFNSLFPGDSKSRTHIFEWTKGRQPWLLEWEADFFATKPSAKGLKWKVGSEYPAVSSQAARKYKNCAELNQVYTGGVARASNWSNKGSRLKQTPAVNTAVYNLNRGLDRDKDGLVCER